MPSQHNLPTSGPCPGKPLGDRSSRLRNSQLTAGTSQVEAPPEASCAWVALRKFSKVQGASWRRRSSPRCAEKLPRPCQRRLELSLLESPYNLQVPIPEQADDTALDTVLYLAYGSNLSAETFKGKRGIKPISAINVVIPELPLTFDLPGIPYAEPCFANVNYRNNTQDPETSEDSEKALLLHNVDRTDYHKDRWKKGLVGVVYEVTKEDYAHIIATEGGGASYQDVLVDCYVLPEGMKSVPEHPSDKPFKAHTLYSPPLRPDVPGHPRKSGRFQRPDPSYAQASARYLKLITDGAEEHNLPTDYKDYLYDIRAYTMTTKRQRLGASIFMGIWMPLITFIFSIQAIFSDDQGKSPKWLVSLSGALFQAMWASYDNFFKSTFGDGERTIYDSEDPS